jgi:hypothetical protein
MSRLSVPSLESATGPTAEIYSQIKKANSNVPNAFAAIGAQLGKLAGLKPDELKNIRNGEPTGDARRDALIRFVRTLAQTGGTVSDDDFVAIKAAG